MNFFSLDNLHQHNKKKILNQKKIQAQSMGKPGEGGTTFVQADSACFRELVQRLTGPSGNPGPPAPKPKQKLHERRKCNKPKIDIQCQPFLEVTAPPMVCAGSPNDRYSWSCPTSPLSMIILSPFSSSSLPSPVGNSNKRAAMELGEEAEKEEEKAIKEKRFYLHRSPRSKPRLATQPELLTLFPLKSPTS